jgi:hypothetical protein
MTQSSESNDHDDLLRKQNKEEKVQREEREREKRKRERDQRESSKRRQEKRESLRDHREVKGGEAQSTAEVPPSSIFLSFFTCRGRERERERIRNGPRVYVACNLLLCNMGLKKERVREDREIRGSGPA